MKGFLKPKLIISLVTVVLLAGAIVGSLAGNLISSYAKGPRHPKPTPPMIIVLSPPLVLQTLQ